MKYTHLYPWQIITHRADINLQFNLSIQYDKEKLRNELEVITNELEFTEQWGPYHKGGWRAVGLISHEGNYTEDRPLEGEYKKTKALTYAPYMESILDSFPCEKRRVRLSNLLPGKDIYWHVDYRESIDEDFIRLHMPIQTNSDVEFQISHEDCSWKEGELWYGDFMFPHRVRNSGTTNRVHMIMDLVINDELLKLFPPKIFNQQKRRLKARRLCRKIMLDYYELPSKFRKKMKNKILRHCAKIFNNSWFILRDK